MRQNRDLFDDREDRSARIMEAALRFFAKHEYLHDDQRQFVLEIADYVHEGYVND